MLAWNISREFHLSDYLVSVNLTVKWLFLNKAGKGKREHINPFISLNTSCSRMDFIQRNIQRMQAGVCEVSNNCWSDKVRTSSVKRLNLLHTYSTRKLPNEECFFTYFVLILFKQHSCFWQYLVQLDILHSLGTVAGSKMNKCQILRARCKNKLEGMMCINNWKIKRASDNNHSSAVWNAPDTELLSQHLMALI